MASHEVNLAASISWTVHLGLMILDLEGSACIGVQHACIVHIQAGWGSGLRPVAHFHSFRRSTKIISSSEIKASWCLNILEVIKLLVTESEWCLPRVHFVSCILVHILKRNNKGTQPWSKTNWPFSMENMSCRLGGGVPAYLPPLFLRTKQAMSATRVSSATAHMVPMNQPWVEKSLRWPTAPENKNGKGTQSSTHRLHTSTYLSMTVPSSAPHTTLSLTENRDTWWILVWEDVLTSHCLQL